MKAKIGYKFIGKNMKSRNGNHTWEIGKWYKEKDIKICKKGFHACKRPIDALEYVYGDKFFIVEYKGKIITEGNKFVSQEMRLIKEIPIIVLKRFALFCAKYCLKNYEKEYPNDKRVSDCIKATEEYLDGKISLDELSAARSAAWSAAWSATRSAARFAARSAAESAESAAESAARSAATSAAESAAESAESAARFAAWSAARSAARLAARLAARSAQNKELLRLIKAQIEKELGVEK
jgi:hypothetical protein